MGISQKSRINGSTRTVSVPMRIAGGGVAAAVLVGGASVAAASQKDVVVDVNGKEIPVSTMSGDVQGALEAAGVEVGTEDLVYPAPSQPLEDSETVSVKTAKQVSVVVDGQERDLTSNAVTVKELLQDVPAYRPGAEVNAEPGDSVSDGTTVEITQPKIVSVNDGGEVVYTAIAAETVGEVLEERGIELDQDDTVTPAPETPLENNMSIDVKRVATEEVTEQETFDVPTQYTEDPNAPEGKETVVEWGQSGLKDVTSKVTTVNGEVTGEEVLNETVVREATPAVVSVGTKAPEPAPTTTASAGGDNSSGGNSGGGDSGGGAAAPAVANGGVWDRLAQCESGGNWSINTGNGFSGGLQFHPQTWQAYGGGQYASTAAGATREQQIAVAEKVQAAQGWGAWPACTSKLGIR